MLAFHVLLSLAGMLAGLALLWGLFQNQVSPAVLAAFFVTLGLTDLTGFPLAPFGFDPPRAVGLISLVLLIAAAAGYYAFKLAGVWRIVFVVCAVATFYLDVFVGIVQAFQKVPFLAALAPTQSEPPFVVVQALALLAFVIVGTLAVIRFKPSRA
jgi:hypothetical protein